MILYGYKVYKPYPNLNSYYFIAKLEMLIGEQTASVGMGNESADVSETELFFGNIILEEEKEDNEKSINSWFK